jgi:hypothetical protein
VIDQNPYRDLIHNPLREEQVERLAASVRATGYWPNTMVRKHPTRRGRYQLGYGHARLEAARKAGITAATFLVSDLSDEEMIHVMVDENVTQFGKDQFATYKEATIAAATWIMRAVIDDPSATQKFSRSDPQHDGKLVAEIRSGGCPGERIIFSFFNGTVPVADIRLALQAFRETGELAAWHEASNPKLERKDPAPEPTLDPEALKKFTRSDHVRTFSHAVRETGTPVALQAKLADTVVEKLGEWRRKGERTDEPSDHRFNSQNIRQIVVEEHLNRTRNARRKAELERIEQMTSLERGLMDLNAGMARTLTGFRHIVRVLDLMGEVTDADMTVTADHHFERILKMVPEFDSLIDYLKGRKRGNFSRLPGHGER